jgi:hypothetical protein
MVSWLPAMGGGVESGLSVSAVAATTGTRPHASAPRNFHDDARPSYQPFLPALPPSMDTRGRA